MTNRYRSRKKTISTSEPRTRCDTVRWTQARVTPRVWSLSLRSDPRALGTHPSHRCVGQTTPVCGRGGGVVCPKVWGWDPEVNGRSEYR